MTLILTAATLWLVVIPAAICLLLGLDRGQDEAWEAERPERPVLPQRDSGGYLFPEESEAIYEALCFEFWEREVSS